MVWKRKRAASPPLWSDEYLALLAEGDIPTDYGIFSRAHPSSSQLSTGSCFSTPPAKRSRKSKACAGASAVASGASEKRPAIFKKRCPQNIQERVERVMSQRFFMVDRRRESSPDGQQELREEFDVLGSTGNVYTVVIDKLPSCTCPDATKGNHCKHILFIFLKVLQVTQASGYWYQKGLLTSELQDIFSSAPVAPNAIPVAPTRVREEYARATGRNVSTTEALTLSQSSSSSSTSTTRSKNGRTDLGVIDLTSDGEDEGEQSKGKKKGGKGKAADKRKLPEKDDDCPICYETLYGIDENKMSWCETCGKAVHGECFGMWKNTAQTKGHDITCVYCRAKWVLPVPVTGPGGNAVAGGSRGGGGVRVSEGYLNLSRVAGLSPVRDTSSYYQGPRRGTRHYGYQDYW